MVPPKKRRPVRLPPWVGCWISGRTVPATAS